MLEGVHALKHAIRFGATIDIALTPDSAALTALATRLAPDVAVAITRLAGTVSAETFAGLSPTPPDTGVIAIARRRHDALADVLANSAPIVLLESPSHSGNIGAAVRASAAAGAGAVLATGSNDPWNPGALRGSAGLHFALPVMTVDLNDIPSDRLIAVDPDGISLAVTTITADAILAFGSERAGLSDKLLQRCGLRVAIPMEPGVSSLNLATSVAVMLYHWKLAQ